MLNLEIDELKNDDLYAKIKERKNKILQTPDSYESIVGDCGSTVTNYVDIPLLSQKNDEKNRTIKDLYSVEEILAYEDRDFIRYAYLILLNREPDEDGMNHFLGLLRSGDNVKIEILWKLRESEEGKKVKGAAIFRLKRKYYLFKVRKILLRKIPLISHFLRFCISFVQLSRTNQEIHKIYAREKAMVFDNDIEINRIKNQYNEIINGLNHNINIATEKIDGLEKTIVEQENIRKSEFSSIVLKLESAIEQSNKTIEKLDKAIETSDRAIKQSVLSVENTRNIVDNHYVELLDNIRHVNRIQFSLMDQKRQLRIFLEEARKRLPEPFDKEQLETLVKENHYLDSFYVEFEDVFRGSRSEIKERQKVYISYIERVKNITGVDNALDVGCGRGEWLELLRENHLEGKGLDLNHTMVIESKSYGLNVEFGEAISFLRKESPNSYSAITGFHIIEHLELNDLIALFDESLRVLVPGGVVIFETPNPENLIVGSCNFYTDPTHKNPIPPHTARFMLEQRGFNNVEIKRLHPMPGVHFEDEFINHQFSIGQDYSVIGYKVK